MVIANVELYNPTHPPRLIIIVGKPSHPTHIGKAELISSARVTKKGCLECLGSHIVSRPLVKPDSKTKHIGASS